MGVLDKKTKAKKIEKALYEWLNLTEEVEVEICKMLDGEILKKDLKSNKILRIKNIK